MSSLSGIRCRPILASAAVGLALAGGCGGDDDETTPPPAPTPATVTIQAITASSGRAFQVDADSDAPRFLELGCDPDRTVAVSISLGKFTLRPPGACGGNPQCGTVRVSVDGQNVSERSSASAPSLALAGLPLPGEYVFRAQLLNDAGEDFTLGDPEDTVTVELRPPSACGGPDASTDAQPQDAGPDAEPDTGSDARDAAPDHSVTDAPADTRPDTGDGAVQG